ncbi:MAG: hypothetical protein MK135_14060, partial [Polyangiaceae bacterium]|nr:hypothetical protein [Polyangiaceae bacterium]
MIFLWAILGVFALLIQALVRLIPYTVQAIRDGLTPTQWLILIAWTGANLYMEGYRGFQKRFVPRVLARAHHLEKQPQPHHVILGPFFAMAYFHSSRRAKIAAAIVTVLVLLAIIAVRQLAQPWRGIVDAGVIAGLTWG